MLLCIFIIFFNFVLLLSIPFFKYTDKPGIDKSTEVFAIPACPRLMCFFFFFNRGNTEGTYSSKNVCLMFVYVLFM